MARSYDDILKLKVCLVGDSAVGKTSMIRKYVYDEFSDKYLTTLGTKITKKEMTLPNPNGNGDIAVDMAVWDIMGQHGFRALLQEAYFFGVDGIIAVCDITRKETLEGLKDWLERTRETAGNVPIVTVGNKCDLDSDREVSDEELAKVAEEYDAEYTYTSAKSGDNIEKLFVGLTTEILRRIEERKFAESLEPAVESPTGQAS